MKTYEVAIPGGQILRYKADKMELIGDILVLITGTSATALFTDWTACVEVGTGA